MAVGFQIELEFRKVSFRGTRETGELGKPLPAGTKEKTKHHKQMMPSQGFIPKPDWWKASVLTSAPALHPQ